jgi:hypothetical protein
MPLTAWFSSERGSPRTRSTASQDEPFQVSLVRTPELVSRFFSISVPWRASLEDT